VELNGIPSVWLEYAAIGVCAAVRPRAWDGTIATNSPGYNTTLSPIRSPVLAQYLEMLP